VPVTGRYHSLSSVSPDFLFIRAYRGRHNGYDAYITHEKVHCCEKCRPEAICYACHMANVLKRENNVRPFADKSKVYDQCYVFHLRNKMHV